MSLWEIIVDGVKTSRSQKVEKGMNVELNIDGMSDPFCSNEGRKAIADAFERKYGGDNWLDFVTKAIMKSIRK